MRNGRSLVEIKPKNENISIYLFHLPRYISAAKGPLYFVVVVVNAHSLDPSLAVVLYFLGSVLFVVITI